MKKKLLITGGAGFIGTNLIFTALKNPELQIINIDKLSYSSSINSLDKIKTTPNYSFIKADIVNREEMEQIFAAHEPDMIMHLAAESHVDRSIDDPAPFIINNINGTFSLLETARKYWYNLKKNNPEKADSFRFHHISTDEVFGDLKNAGKNSFFSETSPYAPSSPYSASKASSDHLVRAWQRTYGLPTIITNCSNNYGPYQFPEKLIPLIIINALSGKKLPIYGEGQQIRDWLHVEDHARALLLAISQGIPGNTYVIGGHNEKTNLEVVSSICEIMDDLIEKKPEGITHFSELITHVKDRPGHDARYAIDPGKISKELGWKPQYSFESGLKQTVKWYLENPEWWRQIQNRYQGQRLGLANEQDKL